MTSKINWFWVFFWGALSIWWAGYGFGRGLSLLYTYSALLILQSPITLYQVYKMLKEKFKKHKLSLPKRVAVTILGSVAALLYSPFHLLVVKEFTKKNRI